MLRRLYLGFGVHWGPRPSGPSMAVRQQSRGIQVSHFHATEAGENRGDRPATPGLRRLVGVVRGRQGRGARGLRDGAGVQNFAVALLDDYPSPEKLPSESSRCCRRSPRAVPRSTGPLRLARSMRCSPDARRDRRRRRTRRMTRPAEGDGLPVRPTLPVVGRRAPRKRPDTEGQAHGLVAGLTRAHTWAKASREHDLDVHC